MHNHNDTIIKTTESFRKIYLSLYLKGLCVRGSWRPNRTATLTLLAINAFLSGGARGVMVIIAGNVHGDTSSNPGRDWLHFT